MKQNQSLVTIWVTILALVVGCSSWVLFAENAWSRASSVPAPEITSQIPVNPKRSSSFFTDNQKSVPAPEITSQIPVNPKRSSSLPPYNPEIAFGEFAWQAFVALNWPADCEGKPLGNNIGEASDAPRVWEFYNDPEQIFLPEGKDPSPVIPTVPPQCEEKAGFQNIQNASPKIRLGEAAGEIDRFNDRVGTEVFESLQLFLQDVERDVERFKQQQEPKIAEEIDRAISIKLPDREVLVDQSKNYILSEIRLNPIEVGQIVDNEWYSAANLQGFNNNVDAPADPAANPFALVCSQMDPDGTYEDRFPCLDNNDVGAIELKAAWMVLPDPIPGTIESKYYTTFRTFLVKEDMTADGAKEKEVTVPVALIGFHIVQKTSQQGWSWATFEHLDNAPDEGQTSDKPYYNLFNPGCKENCEENHPYAEKPYLWRDEYPHAVTKKDGKLKEQIPSQITRVIPITNVAKSLNDEWQEALGEIKSDSIWQKYELIGVQWLNSPNFPYEQPTILPSADLANVALEPYVQTDPPIGTSCINCHVKADLPSWGNVPFKPNLPKIHADFSFLLNYAQSPDN
ncbi:MAG: hypothetical protein AB4352_30085 [Hormoscilla sp.]